MEADSSPALDRGLHPDRIWKIWQFAIFSITLVTAVAPVLSAYGWLDVDFMSTLSHCVCVLPLAGLALAGRVGSLQREFVIDRSVSLTSAFLTANTCYTLLAPWTRHSDIALLVGDIIARMVFEFVKAGCHVAGLLVCPSDSLLTPLLAVGIAGAVRVAWDTEARAALQTFPIMWIATYLAARVVRSLGDAVAASQTALKMANSNLLDLQQTLSRMLNGLCDVVVWVDADLCMQDPSMALLDLLMSGRPGTLAALQGCSLTDFAASEEDARMLRAIVSYGAQTMQSEPLGRSGRPVSAVVVKLRDATGSSFLADVFHARLTMSGEGNGPGPPQHLLGLRLHVGEAARREPPPAEPNDPIAVDVNLENRAELLRGGLVNRPGGAGGSATTADSRGGGMGEEPRPVEDPSAVAIRFDAGSTCFRLTGSNVIVPLRGQRRCSGTLLLDLVSEEDAARLNEWVAHEVQEEQIASSRGEAFQPTLYGRPLAVHVPAMRASLGAQSAWLQIDEAADGEEIPVTLWLQGLTLKIGQSLPNLGGVVEGDDQEDSFSVSDGGGPDGGSEHGSDTLHESAGAGLRLRPRPPQ